MTSPPTMADQLETRIRQHRLLTTPATWDDEIIFPYYDGLSLINIPHTISEVLGAPMARPAPLQADVWQGASPEAERVVLFLMDGMGYKHLRMLMAADPEIAQAVADLNGGRDVVPLTSIAPSTTAVALPSLWTGATPGETGLTGTYMFLKEISVLADTLMFKPVNGNHPPDALVQWGAPPESLVQVAGFGEHLSQHNIPSYVITNRAYTGKGLSRILNRGVTHNVPILSYSDVMLRFRDTLRETQGERCYIWMYWSGVDSLAHTYGAHSEATNAEIKRQLLAVRDTLADATLRDGQTLFMMLADHGHYDSTQVIDFGADALLQDAMLFSLAGDERHGYVYLRHGALEDVKTHIEAHYADKLTYIEAQEALASGYFGNHPADVTRYRVGDLVLIPRLGHILGDPVWKNFPMISRHAGVSDWEMLVPFIWHNL